MDPPIHMGSDHGSGSSKQLSKDTDTDNQKDNTLRASLISLVDSDHESEASLLDIETDGNNSGTIKKSRCSNSASSSSSSSESLADDFFQIDADMLKNSRTSLAATPVARGDEAQTPVSNDRNDDKLSDLSQLEPNEADNSESPLVPSPHLSEAPSISPGNSPLPQVMERPGGFDPNRIPASVFSSTPSNAADWSVASNDSLFSIQLGNNSFSREQFLMMGGDVNKLGLYNSGELLDCTLGEVKKSGELNRSGLPPLSLVKKLPSVNKSTSDVGNKPEEVVGRADETLTDSPAENCDDDDDHFEDRLPRLEGNSSSINRQSNGSGASCQSFAFPILVENGRNESSLGFAKQQNSRPTDYEESPKPNEASDSWWCCCSGPSWSCSSCWSFSWCSSCRQHYCCC